MSSRLYPAVSHSPRRHDKAGFLLVGAALLLYVAVFGLTYPEALMTADETHYVEQAVAFTEGSPTIAVYDPAAGQEHRRHVSRYAPGTSLLMTPLVALFGWRGACAASLPAMIVLVLVTAMWIYQEGRSPLWAMLVLGYPTVLTYGRIGMSEMPGAAAVTLSIWLLWRGWQGRWLLWLASGVLAAASLVFREANAVLLMPLLLGAMVRSLARGKRKTAAMIVGGMLGLGLWAGCQYLVYGEVIHRAGEADFELHHVVANLPVYLVASLVMVPGGLLWTMLYRGRFAVEIIAAVAVFLAFFLTYGYSGQESGGMATLLVGAPRFWLPVVPLTVFAMSESLPRLWGELVRKLPPRLAGVADSIRWGAVAVVVIGVLAEVVAVQVVLHRVSASRYSVVRAIYGHTPAGSVIVHDGNSTHKYVNDLYGKRAVVDLRQIDQAQVAQILDRHGTLYVVLLPGGDSKFTQERNRDNERIIAELLSPYRMEPVHRQTFSGQPLRIWRVTRPAASQPSAGAGWRGEE